MRTTPTKETAYGMYNTYVGSYFSMNQYPLVCDDVAYDVSNDEIEGGQSRRFAGLQ